MAKRTMPDFNEINALISSLQALDLEFQRISTVTAAREKQLSRSCREALKRRAAESLRDIPIEELKNAKAGIRVGALQNAGFHTLLDIYNAENWKLRSVEGIGDKQVTSVRNIINEFLANFSKRAHIRLTVEDGDRESRLLIKEIARYRQCAAIGKEAEAIADDVHDFIAASAAEVVIRNRFNWIFSRRQTKENTIRAVEELLDYCRGPQYSLVKRLITGFRDAENLSESAALEDFKKNGASYYALIERLTGAQPDTQTVYSSIPMELAEQIDAYDLDLREFNGDLRAYQRFGTRYILTQGRVLLGDEMGLGKTIQAIAAMAHLYAEDPTRWFLVVCPASVMINWCREVTRFSRIPVYLLHGPAWEDALKEWKMRCGAAVTNYESLGKIINEIDGRMELAMLIIDEAHYIKNPEAKRTRYIHSLEDESERILMMTGTPLENRVEEMCELVGFVRPDMVKEIRKNAGMRHVPEFKEILAPVYLRRQREMVLDELPPITVQEEWCEMTPQDREAYAREALDSNFMGLRRVSFLQKDMSTSSKAARLYELCEQAADEGRKVIVYSFFRDTIRKVIDHLGGLVAGSITGSTPAEERQALIDRFSGSGLPGLPTGAEISGRVGNFESPGDSEIAGGFGRTGNSDSAVGPGRAGNSDSTVGPGRAGNSEIAGGFGRTGNSEGPGNVLVCQVQAGGTGLNIQAASIVIFCEPQIKPSLEWQAVSRVYRMGQVRNVLVCHLLCEDTIDEAVRGILAGKEAEFDMFAQESAIADAADGLADKEWIRQAVEKERLKYQ